MNINLDELIEHHREQCGRFVLGYCHTRSCLRRGNWQVGDLERYETAATCIAKETVEALEKLIALDGNRGVTP